MAWVNPSTQSKERISFGQLPLSSKTKGLMSHNNKTNQNLLPSMTMFWSFEETLKVRPRVLAMAGSIGKIVHNVFSLFPIKSTVARMNKPHIRLINPNHLKHPPIDILEGGLGSANIHLSSHRNTRSTIIH
jgi:hypothetical protein